MRSLVKYLALGLIAAGVAVWGTSPLRPPVAAQASGTCSVVQSLSANVPAINGLNSGADVIAAFNHARQAEGCTVPLSIDPTVLDSASPQQQMLMLFNVERTDRGLGALQLDSTLLSQIAANHSREMAQYGYFGHPSPINHPGASHVFDRDTANPAISGHWSYLGENIAAGFSPAGAVYAYMYTDSSSSWGHRRNILGTFNWVGIGVANGGSYGVYYSSDFLNGSYTPPASADTTAPMFSAPVITSGSAGGTVTAQVTGVTDSGAASGAAGVTGVVFSAGTATQTSTGTPNTVSAAQTSPGVWTATLNLPAGTTLHAVAVDGSGNYTDCAIGSSCQGGSGGGGGGNPPPANTSINLSRSSGSPNSTVTVMGSGFSAGETVRITWDGTTITSTIASTTGSISRSFSVPQSTNGAHMVTATGQTSNSSAHAPFTVVPRATLYHTSAIHGTVDYATGYGFVAGETVTVHLGSATGIQLGGAGHASSTGTTGSISFTVPQKPVGIYTLYVVGATSGAKATVRLSITG
jgi:uncharacterized protein YkwD